MQDFTQFVLKVSSRCNLACSYCYVYEKGDDTWKTRDKIMSEEVFQKTILRIEEYCHDRRLEDISISFHGGEPLLIGTERLSNWCRFIRNALDKYNVEISVQTNGTIYNEEILNTLKQYKVGVGVSIDCNEQIHDKYRIYHSGKGSYARVVEFIRLLKKYDIRFGILCVVPLHGPGGTEVQKNLMSLNPSEIKYLFPDYTHDNPPRSTEMRSATPCADFLIDAYEAWFDEERLDIKQTDLLNFLRVVLGNPSQDEAFGSPLPKYLFIETNGEIEGLDVLRICRPNMPNLGISVFNTEFSNLNSHLKKPEHILMFSPSLPKPCTSCPEKTTCAGGHLPHRFSEQNLFDNRSIWCDDLIKLMSYARIKLGMVN